MGFEVVEMEGSKEITCKLFLHMKPKFEAGKADGVVAKCMRIS